MRKKMMIQWALTAALGGALAAVAILLKPYSSLAKPESSPFFPSPQHTSETNCPSTVLPSSLQSQANPQISGTSSCLVLVNRCHPWIGGTPENLCTIAQKVSCQNIRLKNKDMRAQEEAVLALEQMANAMYADGAGELIIVSAYRSVDYQDKLFQNKLQRVIASGVSSAQAEQVAAQEVTRPGDSEHHTGYAFDLAGADHSLDSFAGSNQEHWILENGFRYGFIIRYPSDKTDITGIIHEPWHIRYVGVQAATDMHGQGLCLEEYVGQ